MAGLGQRHGEVHRDRRLADTALARRHADDAGLRVRAEEQRHRCSLPVAVPGVVVLVVVVGWRRVEVDARACRRAGAGGARPRSSSPMTTKSSSTSSTPGTARATRWISSASASALGHAATGNATSRRARRRFGFTERMTPSSPNVRFSSGSTTAPSAASSSVWSADAMHSSSRVGPGAWCHTCSTHAARITPARRADPSVDYPAWAAFRSRPSPRGRPGQTTTGSARPWPPWPPRSATRPGGTSSSTSVRPPA